MSFSRTAIAQLWARSDRSAVRTFLLALAALTVALLLALYSGAAAELGINNVNNVYAYTSKVLARVKALKREYDQYEPGDEQ